MSFDAFKSTPHGLLLFGAFLLLIAAVQTCLGKVWGRNGQVVLESENPKTFWLGVLSHFLCGLFMLWLYMRRTFGAE